LDRKSFVFNKLAFLLLFAAVWIVPGHATTIAVSNWDNPLDGSDGWSFVHDGMNMSLVQTGGHGGGFLQIADQALGTTMYLVAPAKFLGNQTAAYGGTLSFDLQQSYDTNYYADDDVLITGNGLTLAYNTGVNPAAAPDWTPITVNLFASSGWKVGTTAGIDATEAQLQSVLSNLGSLWIRPEFQVGPDVDGIDNVVLTSGLVTGTSATPEPSTWLMLAAGLFAIFFSRLRAHVPARTSR